MGEGGRKESSAPMRKVRAWRAIQLGAASQPSSLTESQPKARCRHRIAGCDEPALQGSVVNRRQRPSRRQPKYVWIHICSFACDGGELERGNGRSWVHPGRPTGWQTRSLHNLGGHEDASGLPPRGSHRRSIGLHGGCQLFGYQRGVIVASRCHPGLAGEENSTDPVVPEAGESEGSPLNALDQVVGSLGRTIGDVRAVPGHDLGRVIQRRAVRSLVCEYSSSERPLWHARR